MGRDTSIGWCHHTFNAWWGCHKVSPGCQNCYASALDRRLGGKNWDLKGPRRFFGEKHWNEPRKWNEAAKRAGERRRVFCSSMADVFEDRADLVPERARLWKLISETPHLDWLLLTKRSENFAAMVPWIGMGKPWFNVWLGTTVEDQEHADLRIPTLLMVPAAVRFLSCEPLLGEVDLDAIQAPGECAGLRFGSLRHLDSRRFEAPALISWVIAGAESGPGARTCDPMWLRKLRNQCADADVPFFLKQAVAMMSWDRRNEPITFGEGSKGKQNVIELPYLDGVQHAAFPEVR